MELAGRGTAVEPTSFQSVPSDMMNCNPESPIPSARDGWELDLADDAAGVQVDNADGFRAGITDVQSAAIQAHGHRAGKLADLNGIEKPRAAGIERLNTIETGIGNIDAPTRLIQQDLPQAFGAR